MRTWMKSWNGTKSVSCEDVLARIPLSSILKVTFYKRDEVATDLICCEVVTGEKLWAFHEELPGWDLLIAHLGGLPGFRKDWFDAVSQPAFAKCETVAFGRLSGAE